MTRQRHREVSATPSDPASSAKPPDERATIIQKATDGALHLRIGCRHSRQCRDERTTPFFAQRTPPMSWPSRRQLCSCGPIHRSALFCFTFRRSGVDRGEQLFAFGHLLNEPLESILILVDVASCSLVHPWNPISHRTFFGAAFFWGLAPSATIPGDVERRAEGWL